VQIEMVGDGPTELSERAAVWIADHLWSAVDDRGVGHLAVSGGGTPKAMFAALAELPVPWSKIHVWQVDERVVPDGNPARNLNDLREALLSRVPATAHLFDVTNPDLDAAAAAYAADLQSTCGGVLDVMHLGIGDDGHTASWPPGDRVIDVNDTDAARSGAYQGCERLTLTVPTVNRARHIVFLVSGESKATATAKLVADDPSIPASRVRREGTVLFADSSALGSLAPE
jgi:6-phosphogluconolactonase